LVIFANVTYAKVTCKSLTLDVVREAQISLAVVDRFGLPGVLRNRYDCRRAVIETS
jgi:hypothetical protein